MAIHPMDIGIALAMSRNGFSKAQIASVLGYMPDLDTTLEQLEAAAVPPLPGGPLLHLKGARGTLDSGVADLASDPEHPANSGRDDRRNL
jgi:hypothetical protein